MIRLIRTQDCPEVERGAYHIQRSEIVLRLRRLEPFAQANDTNVSHEPETAEFAAAVAKETGKIRRPKTKRKKSQSRSARARPHFSKIRPQHSYHF